MYYAIKDKKSSVYLTKLTILGSYKESLQLMKIACNELVENNYNDRFDYLIEFYTEQAAREIIELERDNPSHTIDKFGYELVEVSIDTYRQLLEYSIHNVQSDIVTKDSLVSCEESIEGMINYLTEHDFTLTKGVMVSVNYIDNTEEENENVSLEYRIRETTGYYNKTFHNTRSFENAIKGTYYKLLQKDVHKELHTQN